jgi:hypothetical protein
MRGEKRRFLFLESFYGGSHREFADGWAENSRHTLELHTLPARFWKWRMRGAALHFARQIGNPGDYAGLITTDLMSLSDLKALWGRSCPPALLYMHENQLTYPLAPGEQLDLQYGFTNVSAVLYPGCRFSLDEEVRLPERHGSPLIVWNHRWEFDKNPELFFSVLREVDESGHPFRLALLGENYQKRPKAFLEARRRWPKRIEQ